VSSDYLRTSKRAHNENTFLVTHGVDLDHFRKACDPNTPTAEEMKSFRHPVIGFFGLIADWIDLDLIRFLAASRPQWDVVLIGKIVTDTRILENLPNIHMIGRKPYQALPNYAKAFDIAMVPFAMNELTLAANPLKMREYLAAGLPVVATALPEAEKMKAVLEVGRDKAEFLDKLDKIVQSGRIGPQIEISRKMESESWDHKVEELSRIFQKLRSARTKARTHVIADERVGGCRRRVFLDSVTSHDQNMVSVANPAGRLRVEKNAISRLVCRTGNVVAVKPSSDMMPAFVQVADLAACQESRLIDHLRHYKEISAPASGLEEGCNHCGRTYPAVVECEKDRRSGGIGKVCNARSKNLYATFTHFSDLVEVS
jgi:hypothetical protein